MQLLYANDGINYRVISKSEALSQGAANNLLNNYLRYDYITHSESYSSVSNEPEAVTYITSNLNNTLNKQNVIVSKAGKMATMGTPSYYYHAIINDVDDDFFKNQFFEIFNYQFLRDDECIHYINKSIDDYPLIHDIYKHQGLSNDQLITILATFMDHENSGKPTKILVDKIGDDYNPRAREILASIYYYLPYELRKRHGFLSYCKDDRNIGARISFILFNKEETTKIDDSFIDLDYCDPNVLRVSRKYIDYATYLVAELNDVDREAHFDTVSKLSRNGRLRISDCITYHSKVKDWSNGTQEQLLEEWINYIDKASIQKGPLYEMMVDIIENKVNSDYYNDYLFNSVLELYHEDLMFLSNRAAKTIRFADNIKTVFIDLNRFEEWYFNGFDEKIVSQPNSRLQQIYNEEIEQLTHVNIMSEEFEKAKGLIIMKLNKRLSKLNNDVQEEIDNGLEQMGRKFVAHGNVDYETMASFVKETGNTIIYDEIRVGFQSNIEEWIDEHKPRNNDVKEIRDFNHFLDEVKEYISEEKYNSSSSLANRLLRGMKNDIKEKTFIITKTSLLNHYVEIKDGLDHALIDSNTIVNVIVGQQQIQLKTHLFKDILEFILLPELKTIEYLEDEVVMTLLEEDLLDESHFEYLIIRLHSANDVRQVINYFYKERQQLSGRYLYEVLNREKKGMLKEMLKYYEEATQEELIEFVNCSKKVKFTNNNKEEKKSSFKGLFKK